MIRAQGAQVQLPGLCVKNHSKRRYYASEPLGDGMAVSRILVYGSKYPRRLRSDDDEAVVTETFDFALGTVEIGRAWAGEGGMDGDRFRKVRVTPSNHRSSTAMSALGRPSSTALTSFSRVVSRSGSEPRLKDGDSFPKGPCSPALSLAFPS